MRVRRVPPRPGADGSGGILDEDAVAAMLLLVRRARAAMLAQMATGDKTPDEGSAPRASGATNNV